MSKSFPPVTLFFFFPLLCSRSIAHLPSSPSLSHFFFYFLFIFFLSFFPFILVWSYRAESETLTSSWLLYNRELSHSIQQITTSTGQQITKLSDTYETITQKLEELQALITRFAETQKLSDEVVHAFAEGQEKFGLEFEKQIEGLGELQVEVDSIRVLQRRLDLQRGAAELYKARLEAVEERISKQKELEMDWRQRDSRMLHHFRCTKLLFYFAKEGGEEGCVCVLTIYGGVLGRLRIILGVLSILAILWILATPIQDHYLEIDEKPPPPPSPPFSDDVLGIKPEYGGLPKEVVSLEADRLLRARHP